MFNLAVAAMDLSRADRYRLSRLATARSCKSSHLRRSVPGTEEPNRPVSGPQIGLRFWLRRVGYCMSPSAASSQRCIRTIAGVRHPCQATIPIVTDNPHRHAPGACPTTPSHAQNVYRRRGRRFPQPDSDPAQTFELSGRREGRFQRRYAAQDIAITTYASNIASAAATTRTTRHSVTFIAPPRPERVVPYPGRPGCEGDRRRCP